MAHILWRVVFGVSPSVGVKGNSREEGAKKRIFTADGEEKGNLLYTTIHLSPSRWKMTRKNEEKKCARGRREQKPTRNVSNQSLAHEIIGIH